MFIKKLCTQGSNIYNLKPSPVEKEKIVQTLKIVTKTYTEACGASEQAVCFWPPCKADSRRRWWFLVRHEGERQADT